MKSKKARNLALVMTIWLVVHTAELKAQSTAPFTISGTGGNFQFQADGTLIVTGTYQSDNSSGFLWNPNLASLGVGINASAAGGSSIALGCNTSANGFAAISMGRSTADGDFSTASGYYSRTSGFASTASGYKSTASGYASTVFGYITTASGYASTAMGMASTASGYASTAMGISTSASGYYATALGNCTRATSAFSLAVGTWNLGGGNAQNWVASDPLFEVGNGSSGSPSDALVVYKNGNATFQGAVTAQVPAGDIPMFTGSN